MNQTVVENQKPGNPRSEWDLGGVAGASDLEGFATRLSTNRGGTVDFKIDTNSSNYRIDIYRLGYYGGSGARRVHTIQRNLSSPQPPAGGDPSIGLWDAATWSVTASWTIPNDAVSGVYLAKLVQQDGNAVNHIPFVVRDDGQHHDIVFQTADTTWHAYNGWGGANLYGGNAVAGRAYKVSYNRPITTRYPNGGTYAGPQDFVLSAEHAMIRWMERNGYDVTYVTGVDVGPGNVNLTNHKMYMSVGHDEYWSADQRAHVEAARDAGVHLCFLSGNEMYWKTRWEPDINGVANRTLVCYKETVSGVKIDPSPEWTGTWRDPRSSPPSDGGRPENALTGTIFQVDSYQHDRIEVPYSRSRYRFWRNTGMVALNPGDTGWLSDGMLGYEWDESPDNRFRPPTLIKLSETNRNIVDKYLINYGSYTASAPATHHLTLYRAAGGALVFGSGTVFWSFGLDGQHDYINETVPRVTVDPDAQQATVNLFADMGVQPETLQANLAPATASTDVTPPTTVITAPANGASVVQQSQVTISGTASDIGGVVAVVEVSTDNGGTWYPATGTTHWTYQWWPRLPGDHTIRVRAIDDSVNVESPGQTRAVTVTPSANVSLFTPADKPFALRTPDTADVQLGVKFTVNTPGSVIGVRFYKNQDNTGPHAATLWTSNGTFLVRADFVGETASGWQQVNFPAPVPITPGATYIASYHTTGFYAADVNYFGQSRTSGALTAPSNTAAGGNGVFGYGDKTVFPGGSHQANNYWVDVVFARAGGAGNLPPTANHDSGLSTPTNTALVIPASVLLANDSDPNGYPLTVTTVEGATNGTVSRDANIVTFTPTNGYTGSATFQYTISNGFTTASATVSINVGVRMVAQSIFNAADTPAIVNSSDVGPLELGMKFRCAVSGASATGIKFYKGSQNTGTHIGRLWTSGGTLLATVTFTGETASGWQSASFASPVPLTANALYVVS
ncbi:MAG: DUF4082 domain-containing protein, partial [Actinomycetota bacterium]|nr:DUF4082 domain-containing protein [Actinomycetota bacterium]